MRTASGEGAVSRISFADSTGASFTGHDLDVVSGTIHREGAEVPMAPAVHALVSYMSGSGGETISYHAIAEAIGSRSLRPAALVKVHLHAARVALGRDLPIQPMRGRGLRWTGRRHVEEPPEHILDVQEGAWNALPDGAPRLSSMANRLVSLLRRNPGRVIHQKALAEAMASKTTDPSNLVKVVLHSARRAFMDAGMPFPVKVFRRKGLSWDEASLFPEHDVRQAETEQTGG